MKEIDAAIEALEQSIDALEYLEIESDAIPVDLLALHDQNQSALDGLRRSLKQEPVVAWSYESAKAFALQEANKLLDAALLKTYPQGCDNGEVFDLWNKARAAIAQAEKGMK